MAWQFIIPMALGAAQNAANADKERRDRMVSGIQTAYSPWTGMAGERVQSGNPVGNLLGAVSTGMQMNQASEQAAQQKELQDLVKQRLQSQIDFDRAQVGQPSSQRAQMLPASRSRSPWLG